MQIAAVAVSAIEAYDQGSTDLRWTPAVLQEIKMERKRQESKWGPQGHNPDRWMVILMEEVGEAANAILEKDF